MDVRERNKELVLLPRTTPVVEELIAINKGLIYNQLIKFNMMNDSDAESDAYVALYKAALTYTVGKSSSFSTYATVCVYNKLGDLLRKRKSQEALYYETNVKDSDDTIKYLDMMPSNDTADGDIMHQCTTEDIQAALAHSKRLFKSPIQVAIVDKWIASDFKLKQQELAKLTNCSQSYVNATIGQFRFNCKKYMEGKR